MGHSEASVITSIHSHPGAKPDRRSELNSMGVDIDPFGVVRIPDIAKITDNDYKLKTNSEYSNSLYYIYMQGSRNVWQIKKDGSLIPWGNTSITSLIK